MDFKFKIPICIFKFFEKIEIRIKKWLKINLKKEKRDVKIEKSEGENENDQGRFS